MKKFIGYITDNHYDCRDYTQKYGAPSSYIVRRFTIEELSSRYILRVGCLGVYTLFVNGNRINFDFMTQDCTEYSKTITYRDYDISKHLIKGINSIGFIVSDGWYTGYLAINGRFTFGNYPNKIYYSLKNNGKCIIEADGNEVASTGAIRSADYQNGTIIDNNLDLGNFSDPSYDISKFEKVSLYNVKAKLKKSILPPVNEECRLSAKLIHKWDNNELYDFKQNLSGVVRAVFKGNKGDQITIYYGEVIYKKDLYRENLRSAECKDTFILSGKGEEEYFPLHVFRGFRYCKFVFEGNVKTITLEAVHFWSKSKRVGTIKTNNKLVNKIYNNIIWGQRDNFLSIPTDCPQRDERLGWTGDAQIFSGSALSNYDSEKFLINYVHNLMDSMDLYTDAVPFVSPWFLTRQDMNGVGMGWSDAIIIIPYFVYLYTGNIKILEEAYPYMLRFYLEIEKHYLKDGLFEGWGFNDWLSVDEMCELGVYNNSYYAYDTKLFMEICKLVHSDYYYVLNDKYDEIVKLAREKYIDKEGKILGDAQGAYVLMNFSGICSLDEIKDHLVRKVNQFGHLTTGFHSTKYLLRELCDLGRKDLAYDLLTREEYPSWGYMVKCGATTIWERWDSYRKEIGFNKDIVGNDTMNSFNHYSLGSVCEWMYLYMVGIRPCIDLPAYKKTIISPYFDKRVSSVKCTMKTKNGNIRVSYKIENNEVVYNIKANKNIMLEFNFNNKVISCDKLGENEFTYKLEY